MTSILDAFLSFRKFTLKNNLDPENFTFVIKDPDGSFRFKLTQEIPVNIKVNHELDKLMGFKITFVDKD